MPPYVSMYVYMYLGIHLCTSLCVHLVLSRYGPVKTSVSQKSIGDEAHVLKPTYASTYVSMYLPMSMPMVL